MDAPPPSIAPTPLARAFGIIALVIATLYFLVPVYWLIVASTKNNTRPHLDLRLLVRRLEPRHQLRQPDELDAGTVLALGGQLDAVLRERRRHRHLFAVMAGYAIAMFAFPGKRIAVGVIMAGLLLPVALLTVPLYIEFQALGLTNTVWAIIIPSAVSPFGVFLGMVYAQSSVPTELLEAARIDGAGEARIFFTIVMRLLGPAMVTIFLFIFVATWNNFLLPLMMISSQDLKPVTLGLYGMVSYFAPDKGAVMLGALLGVIPLVLLFFALQKYWRSGLAAGAVKG